MDVILAPLLNLLLKVINIYIFIVVVGAIFSWLVAFNVVNKYNRFINILSDFLYRATEPALAPIRRALPNFGGIDFSPVVLILGLYFIADVIHRLQQYLV